MDLFLYFFRVNQNGCVAEIRSRRKQSFLSDTFNKNELHKSLPSWFLVDNGFGDMVPKSDAFGLTPTHVTTAEGQAHVATLEAYLARQQPLPCSVYLDEEVLAKAGISGAEATEGTLGKYFPALYISFLILICY